MKKTNYIPALRFGWLTNLFDPFLRLTMPEYKIKESLIRQANIKPLDKILDFGCGTATLTIMIKEEHPDSHVVGVDVDNDILKIAREKIKKSGYDIRLNNYNGYKLPYSDEAFDQVLSSLVFHHLNRKQKLIILQELYRVTKTDGELHILDFGKSKHLIIRITSLLPRILDGLENTRDNYNGMLPLLIRKSGFRNVEEKYCINTMFGKISIYNVKK